MTNQEILTKAVEQAVENGWSKPHFCELPIRQWPDKYFYWEGIEDLYSVVQVILSHDFAAAFWDSDKTRPYPENWQHHLQQQVISDDPIKYLEKGLK